MTTYLERLAARSGAVGTVLCLGLDPDPDALPAGFGRDVAGVEAFARVALEACLPFVAAVKPNLAFYEAFGSRGIAALERLRALVPADVPVILDGKRGDIGSTSARLAVALFGALGADAITLNPYLGRAAILPLLERADRFSYLLCRTSNPGADELQGLAVGDPGQAGGPEPARETLAVRVARAVAAWPEASAGTVGLVVGATAPAELAAIRAAVPGLAFLVPGLGAQGGDLEAVRRAGPAAVPPGGGRAGGGLVVNVGRAILGAAGTAPGDPADALAAAARNWSARLAVLA
ncbi:MAG TPA: orotidine-5'-phosphate decarboxylase [Candidatus Limnocylindrales bacterium]|nr:orotidine-5'-phosphate decarboxylase [Candidatus Limnocylindrales bacterium]